ncbi:MAG: phosphoribosylanthranilate isomerase [Deltaproteobacteria bacterium]|nr:phosphoribosylanthranilate isomerase [Deltaproteobacteria bacterium]
MPEVKICGITRIEDALAAVECGADALGFVFYRKSPRCIHPEAARRIIDALPRTVSSVGVFVNEDIGIVTSTMEFCGLSMIQLHGNESPDYSRMFPLSRIIKAFSPSSEEDLDAALRYPCRAVLIDASVPGQYGGTGKRADWELAARLREARPLIISGGLSSENIIEAIRVLSPDAVDASSGVEITPGLKDIDRMETFIKAVRTAEESGTVRRHTIFTITASGETQQ